MLLTRLENGDIPSLMQVLAKQYGFDYYDLLENSGLIYEPLNITYGALIDKLYSFSSSKPCSIKSAMILRLRARNLSIKAP